MFSSFASSSYKIDSNYRYKDVIKENYMNFWTIHEGESKKTNQKVSIFKFDKKKFESYVKDRESRKLTYKKIEEGVTSLQKIKHPNFLNIIEPIEVHSSSFIFVSEYIKDNLRGKYGKKTGSSMSSENMSKNSVIFKKGVYELSKALDFMHNVMKKVMVSLNPDNVLIDFKGNWKIGSLFNISSVNDSYYELDFFGDYEYAFNINYYAPEVVFNSKFYYQSDYFSLGLIVYFLAYGDDYFHVERNSVEYYKQDFKTFESKTLKVGYKNLFPLLVVNNTDYFFIRLVNTVLNRDFSMRSESLLEWMTQEFNSDNGSGDNQLIKTLLFIEKGDFHSIASERQLVFLNGLTKIWSQFNKSIVISQIIPLLTEILNMKLSMKSMGNADSQMVDLAFNMILDIGNDMLDQKEFIIHVYDHLVFEKLVLYEPVFGLILQRIDVFQRGLDDEMFVDLLNSKLLKYFGKKYIVVNADQVNIQAIVLEKTFVESLINCPLFELSTCYTDSILLKLFSQTQSLKIKLLCLDVIKQFVDLDKITVYQMNEKVLKLLENNKSDNGKVVISIMEVLKTLAQSDAFYKNNKGILMERILPLLWKSSMSKNLTLSDYKGFQNVLNYVSRQIQELHIKDLERDGPKNDTSKNTIGDFRDVVKTVDMNESTNWIAMKEKEQLEKLNKASVVMKPKDENTRKDMNKGVLTPTRKQPSKIAYDNTMGILQPKVKN
ncbi:unnamed protein product [Hanseniaspora opuntiae]